MCNEYEEKEEKVIQDQEKVDADKTSVPKGARKHKIELSNWIITIFSGLMIAIFCFCAKYIYEFNFSKEYINQIPQLITDVGTVIDNTNDLKDAIEEPEGYINKKFDKIEDRLAGLDSSVAVLKQAQEDYEKILPYARSPYEFFPNAFSSFGVTYEKSEDIYSLNVPTWESTEIIACDRHTMQEYSAKDLEGELLLVPYFEDGQEIYFKGRYNNNNLWEGNCLINAYKNNKLSLIMDAYYENGVLKEYKQVMPFTTAQGEEVWAISDRKNNGSFNSGVTWTYRKTNEYLKEFDMETVTYGDVKSVEDFKKSITLSLEGFYHGNTSDGKFNDETGEAYLVKYFPDGTVRTLYSGRFKNGMPNDNSGQAWCISKNAEDDEYYFRNDIYINGDPQHKNKYEVLTQEKLQTLLKDRIFECDLTGLVDEKTV